MSIALKIKVFLNRDINFLNDYKVFFNIKKLLGYKKKKFSIYKIEFIINNILFVNTTLNKKKINKILTKMNKNSNIFTSDISYKTSFFLFF